MHISYTLQGQSLEEAARIIRQTATSPQPLLASIGETLLRINRQRHSRELDPDGNKWKSLAPLTVVSKGGRRQILVGRGDMLRSINYQVIGTTLRLRFSDRKAIWHHEGTRPYVISPRQRQALKFGDAIIRKRVHHPGLPKRRLLGFPASDRVATERTAADYLNILLHRI